VLDGQVLYRDFYEIITPLAFYLFAAVFRVAGTTLLAARTVMAFLNALGAAVLFLLVRRVAAWPEALIAALVFVGVCIPIWPYASAHWISTTLALVAAAVLLDDRWRDSPRARPLAAGAIAGVAICVQQQRGPFLLLWVVLATAVLSADRPAATRRRVWWTETSWAVGGAAAVTLIVLGHAAWAASLPRVVEALYGFAATSYGPMYAGTVAWAGVVPLADSWLAYTWHWLLRWSPLFVVAESVFLLAAGRCPWPRTSLVRACLCVLAACMAASIWYLPDVVHVSFVLPFLIIPGARVVHGLRTASGWTSVPGRRQVLAAGLLAAVVALGAKAVTNLARARSAAPVTFQTGFGRMQGDAFVAGFFEAVRRNLVRDADGERRLYSYPIDAWLYLALPARDSFGWDILAQGFPPRYFAEAVDMLRRRDPGTVVVLSALPTPPDIRQAVDAGYELVEEYRPYQIYARRRTGS
jgi:hypothetical protein